MNRPVRVLPVCWLIFAGSAAAQPGATEQIAAPPAMIQIAGGEALKLGFDFLASFPYEVPPDPPAGAPAPAVKRGQIPDAIRKLDHRRIALTGYLIPITLDNFLTKQFMLVRNPAVCCYGVAPNINEFAIVTMKGEGAQPIMDVPVMIVGKLKVGETFENGFLAAIYQIDGEKLIPPSGSGPAQSLFGR